MAGGNFGGGTGTQADPFIIEDWADLEACAADNSQKYYKVVNDLDANDRNDGVWQQIQFKYFSEIDYDGHKIRNIYTDGTESLFHFTQAASSSQTMTVKNLEIENLYAPNASLISGTYGINHESCKIKGMCLFLCAPSYNLNRSAFLRCSIALNGAGFSSSGSYYFGMKQCSVKLTDGRNFFSNCHYDQCRIVGNIKRTSVSTTRIDISYSKNSVFVLKDDTGGSITGASFSGTDAALPNLVVTSLLGDYTPTATNGILATTAQANDIAWLQEHGFPVVSAV